MFTKYRTSPAGKHELAFKGFDSFDLYKFLNPNSLN